MEDRPKSSVCSLCLKLATVGDKITLSGRQFHPYTYNTVRKEMAIPSRQSMEFLKLHGIPSSTANSGASEFTRVYADMIVQNFIAHRNLLAYDIW